ncbi:transcription repressor OFP6-like [Bidens hawaiensis]|uniref:transcription repressor OFP6-like n=1 Tax=Bidens hawaiensis TaxID=980011 RepID=UPI00404AF2BD
MPTINKKKLLLNTTAVSVGCGSCCRRLKLSKLFHPKPNKSYKQHTYYHSSTSSTSFTTTPSTTTFSPDSTADACEVRTSRAVQGFGRLGGNSLAVEKDSDDPYVDFRESMLQMITEKEIYGKDDLRELLNCFLQLNSPYYHGIIIRAFTEIWNNVLCIKVMHGDQY